MGRVVLGILGALLLFVVAVMGAELLQTYREYKTYKARETDIAAQLQQRSAELRERQEYLRLVLDDPDFLERVVREKLGFAKPNERIYKFEE